MASLNDLREQGSALGYQGDELREFVREQQTMLRDERNEKRRIEKEECEIQFQKVQAHLEKEKLELENKKVQRDVDIERERSMKEIKLRQFKYEHEVEMLEKGSEVKGKFPLLGSGDKPSQNPKGPKIPAFDEKNDEMDSYLRRFERYAQAMQWKEETWATNLSALLKGKTLDVYALLPATQALDYDELKSALLKRFDKTEDGFKRKFRSCRPEAGENFSQCAVRLGSYLNRWVEMSQIDKTYDGLFDLMLRDQFLFMCNRELTMFLLERQPKSTGEMSKLADQFREVRFTGASSLCNQSGRINRNSNVASHDRTFEVEQKKEDLSKVQKRCYRCGKLGHIASECSPRGKAGVIQQPGRGKGYEFQDRNGRFVNPRDKDPKWCGACSIYTDTLTNACSMKSDIVTTCSQKVSGGRKMPVVSGWVEGHCVKVLRDTGCSGIVVRQANVAKDKLTGETQSLVMADGSRITAPVAVISIDTPYLTGKFTAWCLENPIYDLIVGNVEGARGSDDPDPSWTGISAVETRQQVLQKGKPFSKMKVPDSIKDTVTPDDMKRAQEADESLSRIRKLIEEGKLVSENGKARLYKRDELIYREFASNTVENGNVYSQLVVPKQYRDMVLKLAHESLMAGHLGTRKTVLRVLSEFYWPGVQADAKRFCQSCDICQRTVPKGRCTKVPLDKMPLIDEPFKRVAVDIIGPIHPITAKGNRYIVTLVDFATRYPEAIALPSIETERVAEALVDIFCRVGVPKEMLTDMGSQFTSALMAEKTKQFIKENFRAFYKPANPEKETDLPWQEYLHFFRPLLGIISVGDLLMSYSSEYDLWHLDQLAMILGTCTIFQYCSILPLLVSYHRFAMLLRTIYRAFVNVLKYVSCALVIFYGFAFCGWLVLGPYHPKFRNFAMAQETLSIVMQGNNILDDVQTLDVVAYGLLWYFTRIYVYACICLFYLVVYNMILAIVIITYDSLKNYEKENNTRGGSLENAMHSFLSTSNDSPLRNAIIQFMSTNSANSVDEQPLWEYFRKFYRVTDDDRNIEKVTPRTIQAFLDQADEDKGKSCDLFGIKWVYDYWVFCSMFRDQ